MKSIRKLFLVFSVFALFIHANAEAKTTINWWHAFGGRLGELLDEQVKKFNASQNDYEVVHAQKGNYSETLNAGIAAFRAKQQPHLLMVFEVGTASMMAAKGATKPVYEVMAQSGLKFDADAYISRLNGIKSLFAQLETELKLREEKGILPPKFVFDMVITDSKNIISGKIDPF